MATRRSRVRETMHDIWPNLRALLWFMAPTPGHDASHAPELDSALDLADVPPVTQDRTPKPGATSTDL